MPAWAVQAVLLVVVVGVAWLTLVAGGRGRTGRSVVGCRRGRARCDVVIAAGIASAVAATPARRERAWELEAVGVGAARGGLARGRAARAG